jgi:hypothetical protein
MIKLVSKAVPRAPRVAIRARRSCGSDPGYLGVSRHCTMLGVLASAIEHGDDHRREYQQSLTIREGR